MKKKNLISALALTMVLGIGATAYAATTSNSSNINTQNGRLGLGRITSMPGYEYTSNVLKDKLGLTDEEITSARDSGKSLYDLAIEKGLTQEDLQNAMLEEKTKAIDSAVASGKITKEEGDALKSTLKTNIENCTGNFGRMQGRGLNRGNGMMGNGLGRGMMGKWQGGYTK